MLPGSALYAVAGRELSAWVAGGPPISAAAWALLAALALLPWGVRAVWPGERTR